LNSIQYEIEFQFRIFFYHKYTANIAQDINDTSSQAYHLLKFEFEIEFYFV